MRRTKRFMFILALFIIFFSISFVIISSKIIFKKMQNEQEMMIKYEIKKEKCELLKDIAKESIQEGVGIDTRRISNDEIQYHIYNDNESIIFYYYLQDDSITKHEYNATIKLSKEYRVLEEEYSIEIESLDEYIKSRNSENRILSVYFSMLILFAFYFVICILVFFIKSNRQKNL